MKKYLLVISMVLSCVPIFSQSDQQRERIKSKTNLNGLQKIKKEAEERYSRDLIKFRSTQKGSAKDIDSLSKFFVGYDVDGKEIINKPLNLESASLIRVPQLKAGGSLGLDIHGEGMIAGVWDENFIFTDHPAFEGRVISKDGSTYPSYYLDSAVTSHGTHVTGTIAAGNNWTNPVNGFKVPGMADKATVWYHNISNFIPELTDALGDGLLTSNISYGTSNSKYYGASAKAVDQAHFDSPYHVSVFAHGNGPNLPFNMNHYGVSKNAISVANCLETTTYTSPSSIVIHSSSSFGPTADLRIKPDITANGTNVRSTGPLGLYGGSYGFNGSSMAAPAITGSILLLQELYNQKKSTFMLGATSKALLIHTAAETGLYPGPDICFGWGLANIEKAAATILNDTYHTSITENHLATGSVFEKEVVASGSEPLVATLVWYDPPGTPSSDNSIKLINDLDLRITRGNSEVHYPWKLDSLTYTDSSPGFYRAATKGDNTRDNVEKVEVANPASNQIYKIAVSAKGALAGGSQNFSLIISGLSACPSEQTVNTDVLTHNTDFTRASDLIQVSNTVHQQADATYAAGTAVVLKEGFLGKKGGFVLAKVEACAPSHSSYRTTGTPVPPQQVQNPASGEDINSLLVFPNPSKGDFSVDTRKFGNGGTVEIMNSIGLVIKRIGFIAAPLVNFNIQNEPPGMYLVRLKSEHGIFVTRILKE